MSFLETNLGFEFRTHDFLAFFGKKESSLENLKIAYPGFEFKTLWQVHGNHLFHTTENLENNSVKADAHWTNQKNLALISKSADCMPVLAVNNSRSKVLAIHAGWRGVQKKIIPLSLQQLSREQPDDPWEIFIGPHIGRNSFEIQNDCLNLLSECTNLPVKDWYSNNKADLLKIVKNQIESIPNLQFALTNLIFDTKADPRFHSFRRDGELAGRQNSFIVLLS